MKLDYKFVKEILVAMENYDEYRIMSYDLMELLKIRDKQDNIDEKLFNKFIGHIKILHDNYLIEYESKKGCCGVEYGLGGNAILVNVPYRITAQGYEFLDILKNDTAFNKIKDFAITNAIDIGKQIIVKLATGGI